MRGLLMLFVFMPIAEMWLLLEVGGRIGPLPTIGLVLLTAAIGFHLLRRQGFDTLQRGNFKMERGEMPAQEMVEGLMLAVSGALLLTPGFLTDAIGFAGLTPAIRRWMFARFAKHMTVTHFQAGQTYTHTSQGYTRQTGETYEHQQRESEVKIESRISNDVIDAEFKREE